MLYPFNQNWRTSQKPQTLSLSNAVNTGVTYSTPSGTVPNQKAWASAGFRGYGPTMTFPGGSGLDGMHGGCGCGGGCNGGGGNGLLLCALAALGVFLFLDMRRGGGFSYE